MRLFEYQAKELFGAAGIPVPASRLVRASTAEAEDFAEAVAAAAAALLTTCSAVMVKAQLLMGGRGKAGLIRRAATAEEAHAHAHALATGPYAVHTVLVEEAAEVARELYLAVTIDPIGATALVLASADGGVEIEELAVTRPDAIRRVAVDLERGLQPFAARSIAFELGLQGDAAAQLEAVLHRLYGVFVERDAELAEINPLFVTTGDQLLAGDGKVMIDDNSLFRQPMFTQTREHFASDAEYEAALEGIPYLQFDGDISLMCAGAGLTTTVFDLVHYEGGTVANYLEFGGPNYRKARRAMELCLSNDSKVILIVTFGTIARADVMAQGVVDAIRDLKPDRPIVTCIRGTNEEAAMKTLAAAGLEPLADTEEAVRRAVAIAGRPQ